LLSPHTVAVPGTPTEALNVLVVDDDALTRKLMSRMLTRLGHTVTQAEDGAGALKMIKDSWQGVTSPPLDIVFLDK
jgi:CheY-like chemotaxis protein